jgi:DNA-binding MarR family transcriptional regulator
MTGEDVRLPTDLDILTTMADGKRQTSTNLASILDRDRRYVTNRLNFLREEGYIQDPGPADNSRMNEITPKGRIAAYRRDKFVRDQYATFEYLCGHIVTCNNHLEERFMPDLIATRHDENTALKALSDVDGITIASEFSSRLSLDDSSPETAADLLYRLFFWSLADRKSEVGVYEITQRGKRYLRQLPESAFTYETFDLGIQEWVEFTEQLRETYSEEEVTRLNTVTATP